VEMVAGLGASRAINMMELGQRTVSLPAPEWKPNHLTLSAAGTSRPIIPHPITHLQNRGLNVMEVIITPIIEQVDGSDARHQ
jgi:hypothetical protein